MHIVTRLGDTIVKVYRLVELHIELLIAMVGAKAAIGKW